MMQKKERRRYGLRRRSGTLFCLMRTLPEILGYQFQIKNQARGCCNNRLRQIARPKQHPPLWQYPRSLSPGKWTLVDTFPKMLLGSISLPSLSSATAGHVASDAILCRSGSIS
jgi:hypothetical protein